MLSYFWIILGATCAVALETLYRAHEGTFSQVFPLAMLLSVGTTFGVWTTMQTSTSLLTGMVVWSFFTALCRLLSTFIVLHESPSVGAWVAFSMIVAAQLVSKIWR